MSILGSRISRAGLLALCGLIPLCATHAADSIPTVAETKADPKIVANSQEVVVDLVARDKKGKLITDLAPEDITLTDDAVPMKLKALRFVNAAAATKTENQPAAADIAGTKHVTGAHPLHVRAMTLVFDGLGQEARKLAREAAEEMLKTDSAGDLYFAVLKVDRRLKLVQSFTTDHALVRAAIEAVTGGTTSHSNVGAAPAKNVLESMAPTPIGQQQLSTGDFSGINGLDQVAVRNMAAMALKSVQDSEVIGRDMQAWPTLGALLALVRQQGPLPGRKTVVYFSQGLPLSASTKDLMHNIIDAANRADVSIYVAEVSGLTMESRTEAGNQMLLSSAQAGRDNAGLSSTGFAAAGPSVPGAQPGSIATEASRSGVLAQRVKAGDRNQDITTSDAQGSLIELAHATGGFYIGDTNDLRKPARRIVEEAASYYEATYIPTNQQYDGRFHPITVTVDRKNVSVQARKGYLAIPPGTPPDIQPFEAGLLKALAQAELPHDLNFHSEVIRFGKVPEGMSASVVVEIPFSQLEVREDSSSKMFAFRPSILALLKDPSGEVVHKFSQDLPYRGAAEALKNVEAETYTYQRSFTASPGKYVLEVAVGDAYGAKSGAQRIPIEIEAPSHEAHAGLSELSMIRRCDSIPESAASGELFLYRNGRIVPNLSKSIDKTQTKALSTFLVAYPDPAIKAKPALEFELSREGEFLAKIPLELPAAQAGKIPFVASIPTAPLRPGAYELLAILTQGGNTVEQKLNFRVEGPLAEKGEPQAISNNAAPRADTTPVVSLASVRDAVLITRVDSVARPDAAEQERTIGIARQRALEYSETLPNFTCIQVTHRFLDRSGQKHWATKDTIAELLRYQNKSEIRHTLSIDGQKATTSRSLFGGVLASGEFGTLLQSIFDPEEKASFTWKEQVNIRNQNCDVYAFQVQPAHSTYILNAGTQGKQKITVGFHGLVYIETGTYAASRIEIEADNVPKNFPVQESSIALNYGPAVVGGHEYMLPESADVLVRIGRHQIEKNESVYRDYRRFGSESTIQFSDMLVP